MRKFIFNDLNGGLEINAETVEWYDAGFNREDETIIVRVKMTTEGGTIFRPELNANGTAEDRGDEAITALMNALLTPYEV